MRIQFVKPETKDKSDKYPVTSISTQSLQFPELGPKEKRYKGDLPKTVFFY